MSIELKNKNYWDEFYVKNVINEESTFCTFIKETIPNNFNVVDVGCGTGRDSRAFAMNNYNVIGIDQSSEVIKINKESVYNQEILQYKNIDISDYELYYAFLQEAKLKASNENNKLLIYSRFFLHSINELTEEIFFNAASRVLEAGDKIALEFRTIEDKDIPKIYDNHYRRYVNSDDLILNLENIFGFNIDFYKKGQGLSIYKNEDPYLARIICTKK